MDSATDYFLKAKEWNPDTNLWLTTALKDLGQIYENQASYNNALKYYMELVELNPRDAETILKLGTLYYQNGEIEEARNALQNAAQFSATKAKAIYWLDQINAVDNTIQ